VYTAELVTGVEALMRPLRGKRLLQAWEKGATEPPLDRALTMLHAASPETSIEQLAELAIPQLNLQLLRLRQMSFGSTLSAYVPCPHCASRLEFTVALPPLIEQLETTAACKGLQWKEGTLEYWLRPANSRDLMQVQAEGDSGRARALLLERCVSAFPTNLTQEATQGIDAACATLAVQNFNQLHAAAEINLQLSCPACTCTELVDFDIARFLWMEVRHAATRLLRDVHELASAYGWNERAILAMTPQRRNAYLEMVRS